MLQRILSLLVALVYLGVTFAYFKWFYLLLISADLIFCLACIWFAEAMGNYTGTLSGNPNTGKSPAFLVRFFGWLLLLMPALLYGLILLSKK